MKVLAAILAPAMKIYGMTFYLAVKIPGGHLVKINACHVKVSDAAAFPADKMVVIHTVTDMNSGYFANVRQ